MKATTVFAMFVLALGVASATAQAQQEKLPDADLLKGIPPRPSGTGETKRPKRVEGAGQPGEDLGRGPEDVGWNEILGWMQEAAQRLSAGDTAPPTQQLQQNVIRSLAKLAEATQSSTSTTPSEQQPDKAGSREPKQSPSSAPQQAAKAAGSSSNAAVTNLTGEDTADLAARIWGQLPPGLQSRLRAAGRIEFLPGYEKRTERYYRSLGASEEGR